MDDLACESTGGCGWWLVILAALTVVGAGLRFSGLDARDFWFDESCTFIYVHDLFDWPAGSSLLAESTNLPYYIALRGWVSLFGDSEASYRSLSALAACLTVPLLGLLAGRLAGRLAALVCAALVAFHPLHIFYAHEARAYALWVLLLSITLYLLVEATRRTRWSWWIAYGGALLACLHLHYFTLYWVPASAVCVFIARDQRRALRRWLVITAIVAAAFVPYFVAAVLAAAQGGGSGWIADQWEPSGLIGRSLWAFLPAGAYPAHLRGLSIHSPDSVVLGPSWIVAVSRTAPVAIVVIAFAVVVRNVLHGRDKGSTYGQGRGVHLFLGGLTLLPLVFAWLYSVLVRPNYLVGRYDLVAWPACIIWVSVSVASFAHCIASKRPGLTATGICALLITCSMLPIARMAALQPPLTFHHVRADKLALLVGPSDLVIAFSYDRDHLLYYLHRARFPGTIVSYPSWLDRQIGWVDATYGGATSEEASPFRKHTGIGDVSHEQSGSATGDLAPANRPLLHEDALKLIKTVETISARGGRTYLVVDSLARAGSRPRAAVNDVFLKAVANAGWKLKIIDEELMILQIERPAEPPQE